jgi:ketosteroid isomerase-like protein
VLAFVHPEIEIRPALVGGPEGTVYRGVEGVMQFAADIDDAWEDFRVEPDEFRSVDDYVVVLGRSHAVARKSGISVSSPASWLAELRDGQVYRWQTFTRHGLAGLSALEAVGLTEQVGQAHPP